MQDEFEESIDTSLQSDRGVSIIELTEPEYSSLDSEKLARVRSQLLDRAEKEGPRYLVVDLAAVHFLGASLLGILVETWRQLLRQKRRLVLCGLTPYCSKLIHTLNLDKLFEIYPTQRIALERAGHGDQNDAERLRRLQICVQRSEVAWDPRMLRLEYIGDDNVPIRSIIVPRTETY